MMFFRQTIILGCLLFCSAFAFKSHAGELSTLVQTCAACHGSEGISPNAVWPNLAGQKKDYIATQLYAFRSGERVEPQMNAFTTALSDSDIEKLAEHYSSLSPEKNKSSEMSNELGAHVRARCISCHGRQGETVNSEWPNLSGQKASYLSQTLRNYKTGKRKNVSMQVIAQELTEEEIDAVAVYFSKH